MEKLIIEMMLEQFKTLREDQIKDCQALKDDIAAMRTEISGLFRNGPITNLQKGMSALKTKVWIILVIGSFLSVLLINHIAGMV